MALKDHTIDSSKVSEEQIEAIIADRIKYDPANKAVVLLPAARGLTNDKKILLYLTALRGWRFLVKENTPSESATPTEVTKATGIPGGSVRPLLRGLEDSNLLTASKGRYEIPAHNLANVQSLISGQRSLAAEKPKSPAGKRRKSRDSDSASAPATKKARKTKRGGKPGLTASFGSLLAAKWFAGGKTINDLKKKLDEMTVFPPLAQLPTHLLKACRDERLTRSKEDRGGKQVWVYKQK